MSHALSLPVAVSFGVLANEEKKRQTSRIEQQKPNHEKTQVYHYLGVGSSGGQRSSVVPRARLAACDVAVTSYDVLRADIHHDDAPTQR